MSRSSTSQTNGTLTRYLPCQIEPGMFHGEWLVRLDAISPENPGQSVRVQLLVDQREVANVRGSPRRRHPSDGWLRVALAGREGDFLRVVLPQPAQPFGEIVLVREGVAREEPGT